MMGRDHAMLGAIGGLGLLPFVHGFGLPALTPASLAVGATLSAGAALLPDMDHPQASPGRTFPAGRWVAQLVNKASGGHRHATHSLAGAAVIGGLAWWGMGQGFRAREVLTFVLVALAVHILFVHRMWSSLAVAAAVTLAVARWVPDGRWPAVAVIIGVSTHIAGDMLNPEGCPLLWPGPWRTGVPLFTTGSLGERLASVVMAGGVGWLAWLRFG